jgi:hypothetical protein
MNVHAWSVAAASLAPIAIVGLSGCSTNNPAPQSTTSATTFDQHEHDDARHDDRHGPPPRPT